jgi:Glyoxalase-like domain
VARCHIDHIAITAPKLEWGGDFVFRALGVRPQTGGEHPRMGTHNLLLRLGASMYLEVIAPNPAVARPRRPRWFALDELSTDSEPRLAAWVARTDDIHATQAALMEYLGEIEPMTRGSLQWLITVPANGCLPLGGAAPALIEWQSPIHPASTMLDMGCSLQKLEAFHPDPGRVSALLHSLGLQDSVQVSPLATRQGPYLIAHILTPNGLRTLGGPDPSSNPGPGASPWPG